MVEAGYTAIYDDNEVILYNTVTTKVTVSADTILKGWRCPRAKLWCAPLVKSRTPSSLIIRTSMTVSTCSMRWNLPPQHGSTSTPSCYRPSARNTPTTCTKFPALSQQSDTYMWWHNSQWKRRGSKWSNRVISTLGPWSTSQILHDISPSLKKCKRDICAVNDRAYAPPKRNLTSSLTIPPYPHMNAKVVYLFAPSNSRKKCTPIKWGIDLSSLLGSKFWTRLLGSWKHVSRSWYVLIRKLWEIKVWFLYLKESSNEWWYMCVSCRILHDPVVFDTCYWWTHVPSDLCGCACRRAYVRGSLVIGLVWGPIQVLLCTRWYLSPCKILQLMRWWISCVKDSV